MPAMEEANPAVGAAWTAVVNRHPKNTDALFVDVIQSTKDFAAQSKDEETGNSNPILKVIELKAPETPTHTNRSPQKANLLKSKRKESTLASFSCLQISQRAKGLVLLNLVSHFY